MIKHEILNKLFGFNYVLVKHNNNSIISRVFISKNNKVMFKNKITYGIINNPKDVDWITCKECEYFFKNEYEQYDFGLSKNHIISAYSTKLFNELGFRSFIKLEFDRVSFDFNYDNKITYSSIFSILKNSHNIILNFHIDKYEIMVNDKLYLTSPFYKNDYISIFENVLLNCYYIIKNEKVKNIPSKQDVISAVEKQLKDLCIKPKLDLNYPDCKHFYDEFNNNNNNQ